MSSENYSKEAKLKQDREGAKHGDFFFAEYYNNSGQSKRAPVFIISNDGDKEDVIICTCTSQASRGDWDKLVQLRKPTYIRTNKIYTIRRDQLLFKINYDLINKLPNKYKEIMDSVRTALDL